MTAKKPIIAKSSSKKVNTDKKQVKEKPVYKPVFLSFKIKRTKKIDANYYGIKQKLKGLGIDLFKKLKSDKPVKEKNENKNLYYIKIEAYYNQTNLLILSYWGKYCKLWNEVINHE